MAAVTEAPPRKAVAHTDADHGDRRDRVLAVAVPAVLVAVAALLRVYNLDFPGAVYFDETYYVPDAQQILARGVEEGFVVHPPVGKWLIAAGIAIAGDDPFGWRLASAVAGTVMVLVTYLVGLRLFRHRGSAAVAGLLVAVDGLALTMSRITMLDIFLAMFVLLAVWFLLIDRDQTWTGVETLEGEASGIVSRRLHPFRWLAGIALGLAVATKWSGALAIVLAVVFVLVSEALLRRRVTGSPWRGLERSVASVVLALVVLPAVVYVTTYTSWFVNYEDTRLGIENCPEGVCPASVTPGFVVDEWFGEQDQILGFHRGLTTEHPYRSSSLGWPILARPVAYEFDSCDDPANPPEGGCIVEQGNVAHILGIGNPAIWWLALLAYPAVAVIGVRRRDWRAGVILLFLLGQYLPWVAAEVLLPTEGDSRTMFLFYALPAVPFICLSLAYVGWRAAAVRPSLRVVPAAIAAIAVLGFAFFVPILIGTEISRSAWDLRILFSRWI